MIIILVLLLVVVFAPLYDYAENVNLNKYY